MRDGLDSIQDLSTTDKIERFVMIIENAVLESNPKQSELFMRFILNRGLEINKILDKELDNTQVGSSDAKLRALVQSVKMSLNYYDIDMQILSKKSQAPFVRFGIEYFTFLNDLNKSIFDASAQYQVQKFSLELLQWDMYRDLNNVSYAPQILKINNNLKYYPGKEKAISDSQAINYIKQMKKMIATLNLEAVATKSDKEGYVAVTVGLYLYNTDCPKSYLEKGTTVKVLESNVQQGYYTSIGSKVQVTNQPSSKDSSQAPAGCIGYLSPDYLTK